MESLSQQTHRSFENLRRPARDIAASADYLGRTERKANILPVPARLRGLGVLQFRQDAGGLVDFHKKSGCGLAPGSIKPGGCIQILSETADAAHVVFSELFTEFSHCGFVPVLALAIRQSAQPDRTLGCDHSNALLTKKPHVVRLQDASVHDGTSASNRSGRGTSSRACKREHLSRATLVTASNAPGPTAALRPVR